MRRWQKVVTGASVTLAALLGTAYGYHRYRMASMMKLVDELPVFSEPAPGARAPQARAFGFAIGRATLKDVQSAIAAEGLSCPDTSMRALMDKARQAKLEEIKRAKDTGSPDSVTGASMVYRRSPKERNPQVRLACDNVPPKVLKDRRRADASGRLLLIFDSPKHPLRHVSYARSFRAIDDSLAMSEFLAARDELTKVYGPPLEAPQEELTMPMVRYKSYTFAWKFADLHTFLVLMNMGDGRLSLVEKIEVPWPVRADAPSRKSS